MITEITRAQIEFAIDTMGVSGLLSAIAEICNEKADHLRENWQDNAAAKDWDKTAHKVYALATKFCEK
jgi:hypothetical protein